MALDNVVEYEKVVGRACTTEEAIAAWIPGQGGGSGHARLGLHADRHAAARGGRGEPEPGGDEEVGGGVDLLRFSKIIKRRDAMLEMGPRLLGKPY
ncbi:MAG: hypothetical protein NTU95_05160 [Methanothrix sp.]|nr:hypothetical protein [Methanothrix sp.]